MPEPHASPDTGPHAGTLIASVVEPLEPLVLEFNRAQWDASVSGSEADANRRAALDAAIRARLADPATFAAVRTCRAAGAPADALLDRQLDVLERTLAAHQMPAATIERLVRLETRLDSTFNNFRATAGGRSMSDNELRDVLVGSDDVAARREAWEASKQVGAQVAPELIELVRLRNEAAVALGHANYYTMMLSLDELDETELFALLDRVDAGTRDRFAAYRSGLDARLRDRFGVAAADVRPWHMSDPFFQEAPAEATLDLDRYFADRDLVAIARGFFAGIGLDLGDLIERADLFEKPGKSQHAFCTSVDRGADVRVLCNLRSNEFWMGVLLHELGHAVYDRAIDPALPWLLRTPAHTLTTEASAMLFGRLSHHGPWLRHWAGVDAAEAARAGRALARASREHLLVMTRWCLVMCHMERALYADPGQDLDALWWKLVRRFQRLEAPEGRRGPDWASKVHFSTAPVYYHNYLLGEMLASQLERTLLEAAGGGESAWDRCLTDRSTGALLVERLFRPGKSTPWRERVALATGAPLQADAFVAGLCTE